MDTEIKKPRKLSAIKLIGIIVGGLVVLCIVIAVISSSLSKKTPTATTVAKNEVVATQAPENTPMPSETLAPSNTPTPTEKPAPTNTPLPTNTPAPTNTPEPTHTPTPLPEPIIFSGTGDSVIDVDMSKVGGIGVARIIGNSGSQFFAVVSYDANGKQVDLLVNTADVYDGIVPIDFNGPATTRLQVSATGEWKIAILPLPMAHMIESPGTYNGTGDDVLLVLGFKTHPPDTAKIIGNKSSRFFAVVAYSSSSRDLLVNTADPYEGTLILDSGTFIFVVSAVGDWSIELKSK